MPVPEWLETGMCLTYLPHHSQTSVLADLGVTDEHVVMAAFADAMDLQDGAEGWMEVVHVAALSDLGPPDTGTLLLEVNGFAGTRPEVLAALSRSGSEACTAFWNVNGRAELTVAQAGARVGRFDVVDLRLSLEHPSTDPERALDAEVAVARSELANGASEVGALLHAWQARTGVALDWSSLEGPWPTVVARQLPRVAARADPDETPAVHWNPVIARRQELAHRWIAADGAVQRRAVVALAQELVRDPETRAAVPDLDPERIAEPEQVALLGRAVRRAHDVWQGFGGYPMVDSEGWCTYQRLLAVLEFARFLTALPEDRTPTLIEQALFHAACGFQREPEDLLPLP